MPAPIDAPDARRYWLVAMHAPVTLQMLDDDDQLLYLYCRDCGHEKEIPPLSLGLSPDYPVPLVSRRLVCGQCRSRKIWSTGQLHEQPLFEMRMRGQEKRHRDNPK